ncbi:MAG TPA: hypothetical protein ENI23_13720, partial [bacterium]|nr:hypothetical protein [bacterium]
MEISLTTKQTIANRFLTDGKDRAILFGGAKGGGKSFLLVLWGIEWLDWLIKFFDIKKSKYPPALGFIGRKRAVDFNDTTLEVFKKTIPQSLYNIRSQEKEIVYKDMAKICYGGLDDEININKFNSAEYCFIGIDQAEETSRSDVSVLQATLRYTYRGKVPPYKELYTANPAECWLKEDFVLNNRKNAIFIPALPNDNPYLPQNYKETLINAFSYDPSLLSAYLEGDWDAFANLDDAVFKSKDIEKCREVRVDEDRDEEDSMRIISADVATKHGDAYTVILYRVGHTIKSIDIYKNIPTTKIAFLIKRLYEQKQANCLVVDSDGFGEGVADVLKAQNIGCTEFHGGYGYEAIDQRRYRNLRTQFYDITSRKVERAMYSFLELPQKEYETLKSQMASLKLKAPDGMGRKQIETKEDMRARGVKSPDLADALVYSEYAFFVGRMSD